MVNNHALAVALLLDNTLRAWYISVQNARHHQFARFSLILFGTKFKCTLGLAITFTWMLPGTQGEDMAPSPQARAEYHQRSFS